jgi:hypothetical protein
MEGIDQKSRAGRCPDGRRFRESLTYRSASPRESGCRIKRDTHLSINGQVLISGVGPRPVECILDGYEQAGVLGWNCFQGPSECLGSNERGV